MTHKFFFLFFLAVVLILGTYKLTESPPTWYDEGMIIQPALNLLRYGKIELQTAPNELVSAGHVSTGYPVIYPVAISFKIFGVGIFQARIVMVFYLLLLAAAFYLLARNLFDPKSAVLAGLLLASFAPLYGHGKNVLGEVPGIAFLLLSLLFLAKFEQSDYRPRRYLFLAFFASGLSVAVKPTFILFIPALAVISVFLILKNRLSWRTLTAAAFFLSAPVVLWLFTQFSSSDSLAEIISFYSNPYRLENLGGVVIENIKRFFTESGPAYFMAMMAVWSAAVIIKLKRQERVSLSEYAALAFSTLVVLSYLRTPGWYRYFFPAQIITLAYFPAALLYIGTWGSRTSRWKSDFLKFALVAVLIGIVIFQTYQVGFDSWVAESYAGSRSQALQIYFRNPSNQKSIFVYDAPEVVTFIGADYYQYMAANGIWAVGEDSLRQLKAGIPELVILLEEKYDANSDDFFRYRVKDRVDRYLVLEPRNTTSAGLAPSEPFRQ